MDSVGVSSGRLEAGQVCAWTELLHSAVYFCSCPDLFTWGFVVTWRTFCFSFADARNKDLHVPFEKEMASFLVENAQWDSTKFKVFCAFGLSLTEELSPFMCLSLATIKIVLIICSSQICILEISLH